MQREDVLGGRSCLAPAAHTCKTDFFFFKDSNQSGTWLLFLPLETPLFALQSLESWLWLLQGYLGFNWFWALAFQRNYYVNGQWPDILRGETRMCLQWAIKLQGRASFLCPVLSGAEQSLMDEKGFAWKASRIWQMVLLFCFWQLSKKPWLSSPKLSS